MRRIKALDVGRYHPNPKEPFLVTTISNAFWDLSPSIVYIADGWITLPRHPMGDEMSAAKYMPSEFSLPLIITTTPSIPSHPSRPDASQTDLPQILKPIDASAELDRLFYSKYPPKWMLPLARFDDSEEEESNDEPQSPIREIRPQQDNLHIFSSPSAESYADLAVGSDQATSPGTERGRVWYETRSSRSPNHMFGGRKSGARVYRGLSLAQINTDFVYPSHWTRVRSLQYIH